MPALVMNARTRSWMWWLVAGAVAAGCVVYVWGRNDTPASTPATAQQLPGSGHRPSDHAGPGTPNGAGIEQLSGQAPVPVNPLDSVNPPQFRANKKGQLVVDEAFRIDLERVYGLYQGPDVLQKLEEFSAHLPDMAKRELRNQYQRYVQYDAAVMQSMHAQKIQEEMTLELAEQELAQLHELRQTYFGEEAAHAMFAQEETYSKQLHDYIRNHTDPALPLMQRVELAQAAWLEARETSDASVAPAK